MLWKAFSLLVVVSLFGLVGCADLRTEEAAQPAFTEAQTREAMATVEQVERPDLTVEEIVFVTAPRGR